MTQADKVADGALRAASEFIESQDKEIAANAGGDLDVLREAADIIKNRHLPEGQAVRSPEHLAFTLISSAFERLVREAQPNTQPD